ncbi:MAG: transposase [Bacteroidota bacterium]|nr:transposase [Bacteroidota bacterium]
MRLIRAFICRISTCYIPPVSLAHPISCLVSSASLHDSQAAIPLMTMTARRVWNLYDLMDSAYDAKEIHAHSQGLGHVPIIDANPRRCGKAQRNTSFTPPERMRYRERSSVERAFGRLKDEYGRRRVRGHKKVMFGHCGSNAVLGDLQQVPRSRLTPPETRGA